MGNCETTPEPWTCRDAVVNGVRLHLAEAGTGPLVLLLHGFPEFHYSWRHQIPALAAAGFRVIAPDLRGYNLSDKPRGVLAYDIDRLVADVLGLIHHAGRERAIVVGHDWGGAIAWMTAMLHPEAVEQLVILNAPHPALFVRALRAPNQLLRSWYMFFFQLPWLPEWRMRCCHFASLEKLMRTTLRPGAFSDEDIRRYREALAQPGALNAAINYYRAAFRRNPLTTRFRPIEMPTLVIWGEQDPYLGIRLLDGLDHWVKPLRVERLPDAGHWVQCEAPQRVNELLLPFLQGA